MKTIIIIALTLLIPMLSIGTSNQVAGQSDTADKISDNLFDAISNIDLVSLNVLLADGANIDTVDHQGNTPLMIAAKIGNSRMVKIMLAHNPDLSLKNNDGNTALMIAAESGQTFVVEQLIENGADLYVRNANGFSILEIAKRNGHAAIVNLLRNKAEFTLLK